MPDVKDFQTYVTTASSLVKSAKGGVKALSGIGIITPVQIAAIATTYLGPVWTLLGKFREYIPLP